MQVLQLADNLLSELPAMAGRFESLRMLVVARNQLERIDPAIGRAPLPLSPPWCGVNVVVPCGYRLSSLSSTLPLAVRAPLPPAASLAPLTLLPLLPLTLLPLLRPMPSRVWFSSFAVFFVFLPSRPPAACLGIITLCCAHLHP